MSECKICNDTGIVQCAEQDGTGVYEQACPEPVHDEPVTGTVTHVSGAPHPSQPLDHVF